jgi:aminomethyltransferase
MGRSRSPFELGLEWLVSFDKPIFNGRRALLEEKKNGSRYRFVYLDVEGNKPAEHSFIMKGSKVIGTVTSAAWCPTAKSNLAFAQVESKYGNVGEVLVAEIYYQRELQWTRVLASCTVIESYSILPGADRLPQPISNTEIKR